MKVYLCGPINGCSDEECNNWRDAMKSMFGEENCIDPMRRDYRGKEAEAYREIVELDKLDVLMADAIIVNYDKPSVGTAMEVLYAWMHHKPIITVCKSGTVISPWLRYHSTKIVHSFERACSALRP